MKKIFSCRWCGSKFKRNRKHKIYCSKECAITARSYYQKRQHARWRRQNREVYNEYMREYMQKYRKGNGKRRERFYIKAGTVYLKKTKDWNEESRLLEKFLKPIRNYR